MEKSCCFTGYRPDKFPFKIRFGEPEFTAFENKLYDAVFRARSEGIDTFYCGMAMGFDLLSGKAVVNLKRASNDCRLIAVIPFMKQSSGFSQMWKNLYEIVLAEADEVIYISDEYTRNCFEKRNKYMVDRSGSVITFFDGQNGGTSSTLKYAKKQGRKIINIAEYSLDKIYANYPSYCIVQEEKV